MKGLSSFTSSPSVVGMVHLKALPGSPGWKGSMQEVIDAALFDADALAKGGVDGMIVENFWDSPFPRGASEAITISALTVCLHEIRKAAGIPVGVNALRNDGVGAMSIAAATGARFIRVNVLSYAMVTDQGIIQGCASEVARVRQRLCPDVEVFGDIMVKHAFPIGMMDIVSVAKDTLARGGADVLVISGTETGAAIDVEDLRRVRAALPGIPLASGSGVTLENLPEMVRWLDIIVSGTHFKRNGRVELPVDRERVAAFVDTVRKNARR
jgi:membrane complex biogenesis BtpA family protein